MKNRQREVWLMVCLSGATENRKFLKRSHHPYTLHYGPARLEKNWTLNMMDGKVLFQELCGDCS